MKTVTINSLKRNLNEQVREFTAFYDSSFNSNKRNSLAHLKYLAEEIIKTVKCLESPADYN